MPNESDTAGTVKLEVTLLAETPFAFVSVKPHAGWTAKLTRETLAEPVQVDDFTLDEIVTGLPGRPSRACRSGAWRVR